jgi:hypothetical protein
MGCEQPRKQIPSPYVNRHLWALWHIEKLADAALDFGAGEATLICTLFNDLPWLAAVSGTDDTAFFEQVD